MADDLTSGIQTNPLDPPVRDLVCGRELDGRHAKAQTEYGGETYYFCSATCYEAFERDPVRYANESAAVGDQSRVPWPGWPVPGADEE
jgi:YHS domain-containing protein